MDRTKLKFLVPNTITFLSLGCGITAILLAFSGFLPVAAILVMISYLLDHLDGLTARRLQAGTPFGLQLDSLMDMVSLGAAPAILLFAHLAHENVSPWLAWPAAVLFPLAGAYRLARFNLLPVKASGREESVGLTISTAGATLALAVLAGPVLPVALLPFLAVLLSLLMVSRIPFPAAGAIFSGKLRVALLLALFGLSLLITSFFNAWFWWTNAYLGLSLARAGYRSIR